MSEAKAVATDSSQLVIPAEALETLLTRVLAEARKPYVDEELEARKARYRRLTREQRERDEAARIAREKACSHLRPDLTSDIAWMVNSDDVFRGCCQMCNARFNPDHPDYDRLIRVPVRAQNIVG